MNIRKNTDCACVNELQAGTTLWFNIFTETAVFILYFFLHTHSPIFALHHRLLSPSRLCDFGARASSPRWLAGSGGGPARDRAPDVPPRRGFGLRAGRAPHLRPRVPARRAPDPPGLGWELTSLCSQFTRGGPNREGGTGYPFQTLPFQVNCGHFFVSVDRGQGRGVG